MQTNRRGFTLIELTLALAFIAILLMLVASVLIDVGNVYQKGVITKDINQLGRETMDVMRRDLAQTSSDRVQFTVRGTGDNKTYRLCLGDVSYVANSSELLINSPSMAIVRGGEPVRLVRTADVASGFCSAAALSNVTDPEASELLVSGTSDIAVHNMNVEELASDANQGLYRVSFMIGTNDPGTISDDKKCRTAGFVDSQNQDYDYCSIAEFTTIVRTGGSRG